MIHKPVLPVVLLIALLTLFSVAAQAAAGPRLDVTLSKSKVKAGDTLTVDVLVKSAPAVYGADVRLAFDPAYLQVVDQDAAVDGIQVINGNFIDASKSFFLQNQVLNDQGFVDYALALLNPAPEAQGNGQLVQIVFKAIQSGQTTIRIAEGEFGTRKGQLISPALGSATLQIGGSSKTALTGPSTTQPAEGTQDAYLLPFGLSVPVSIAKAAGFTGAGILLLGMGMLWRKTARPR